MILPALWIAVCAAAPSVESVLKRMASLAIPDTADYRAVTTVRTGAVTTMVSMHVIQAGRNLRRMEIDAGGRRSVLVTNGGRSSATDLSTNRSVAVPLVQDNMDPSAALREYTAARWTAPVLAEGALWELSQDVNSDSTIRSRTLRWDELAGEVRSLEQVGRFGDTIRIEFEWIRTGGRKVPSSTAIEQAMQGHSIRIDMAFSDWRFPRTIPSTLFTIP